MPADPTVRTYDVDLPHLASAVGQRLHEADVPVTPRQSEQFARALQLAKPGSRAGLYYMMRAVFVTDLDQVLTFDRVFTEIFGTPVMPNPADVAVQAEPARAVSHA